MFKRSLLVFLVGLSAVSLSLARAEEPVPRTRPTLGNPIQSCCGSGIDAAACQQEVGAAEGQDAAISADVSAGTVASQPQARRFTTLTFDLRHVPAELAAEEVSHALILKHGIKSARKGLVIQSNVVLVPDTVANRLTVLATDAYVDAVRKLVKQADRKRAQYVAELKIVEVGENGQEKVLSRPLIRNFEGQLASVLIGSNGKASQDGIVQRGSGIRVDLKVSMVDTQHEEAATRPESQLLYVASYPVADLAAAPPLPRRVRAAFEPLIHRIEKDVAPETWSAVGGSGSIGFFESSRCLVIRQTDDVHRKISELLNRIRADRQRALGVPKPPSEIETD